MGVPHPGILPVMKTHLALKHLAKKIGSKKKDLRRLSSQGELMLYALPFLSSFINIIQSSISLILGLHLGHFLGSCFHGPCIGPIRVGCK